jgi:hypothetical protein
VIAARAASSGSGAGRLRPPVSDVLAARDPVSDVLAARDVEGAGDDIEAPSRVSRSGSSANSRKPYVMANGRRTYSKGASALASPAP